ncbi:MAG: hypothetical protein JXA22_07990 [Candidatus Thermoplasmatota archaeon]|nr:hypothetical protein [Candidatus Thermoplasmatota archaeon]
MRSDICLPLLSVLMVCLVLIPVPIGAQSKAVPEGEPLHLYIRRQPVQDMTYLYFHPPDQIYADRSRDDLDYRETLMQKGSGNDTLRMFYPQDPDPRNNFLQFMPNASLELTYNFVISAVRPLDISNTTYILVVLIDMDMDHDGKYDRDISFEISGEADSQRSYKNGTVPIDIGSLRSFDGERGGRLRVTLSRKDDIDTSVTIYCGYRGFHSWFQLPFSKFDHSPQEDDTPPSWPYLIGFAAILVVCGVAYFYFRSRPEKASTHEKPDDRRSRRKK